MVRAGGGGTERELEEGMMELPGARGRVNPLEGFKLLGALISTKLISEGPVRSPFWFPFPFATAEVEADRLGRALWLTAAGGLGVVIWEVEAGVEEDFEMVLVDLDDLTVLDRLTEAEAAAGEGLVASFEEEGFEERDPEGVISLADVFLLSFEV